MAQKAKIAYRNFYDVPRIFVIQHRGLNLLFDSRFDEAVDDYSSDYEVYVLPQTFDEELHSWEGLHLMATKHVGKIPVKDIIFDATMRKEIDTSVIDRLFDAAVA